MSTALTRSDVLCCAVSCCVALQVRSVTVGEIGIITGSRDTTIKIWGDDALDTCALLHTLVSPCCVGWGMGSGPAPASCEECAAELTCWLVAKS